MPNAPLCNHVHATPWRCPNCDCREDPQVATLREELKRVVPQHDFSRSSQKWQVPPRGLAQAQIYPTLEGLELIMVQLDSRGGDVLCTSIRHGTLMISQGLVPCDGTRLVFSGYGSHPAWPTIVEFQNASDERPAWAWATAFYRKRPFEPDPWEPFERLRELGRAARASGED